MLKVFARIFAVIGFLVTVLILVGIVSALYVQDDEAKEPDAVVLALDFGSPVVEQHTESPLSLALSPQSTSLFELLRAIDRARLDPHVKGLVAHFGSEQPSFAQAQEIRAALTRFRDSGKPTYAFAPSYGNFGQSDRAYYLASAFENIWLQPVGSVSLTGLALQAPFGKGVLDKLGVSAEFFQREEYKSVMESFTREQFSPPVHEMMQGMLNDFDAQIAQGIADSRKWDVAHVKELMASGPYTADEATKNGLVTHIGYSDQMDDEIKSKAGAEIKFIGLGDYLAFDSHAHGKPAKEPTHIALIYGTGLIMDRAPPSNGIAGEQVMGANDIAAAFDDATDDANVKAILFRVDSRGGSPEASETIRRAMIRAKEKGKIVVVSMGDVAASGGYWISMNADKIIAEPGTLTGSIGVVGGKFTVAGIAQKLGVSFDTIKTSDSAGMWSMVDEFTPTQRDRMNALMDQTYHAFVFNVAEARKIPLEKMPDIAKGRVWTGAQAVKIGLVDDLGGYDVALGSLRQALNLTAEDPVSLDPFPAPLSPTEKLIKLLKGFGAQSALAGVTFSQLQDLHNVLSTVLGDVSLLNHGVQARMPMLLNTVQ